ncbi:RICIN domain-containing protein [Streptomyces sp. V4-01]|uniref:RICIN domain-containing protein n=1 Tax=Actinacidiphila polyblastidii TaxID=3110430 RepID=A0ABU7PF97_9ACTN|nr:RICIN domain-containing protein [Streptomyces sp. V4-01]
MNLARLRKWRLKPQRDSAVRPVNAGDAPGGRSDSPEEDLLAGRSAGPRELASTVHTAPVLPLLTGVARGRLGTGRESILVIAAAFVTVATAVAALVLALPAIRHHAEGSSVKGDKFGGPPSPAVPPSASVTPSRPSSPSPSSPPASSATPPPDPSPSADAGPGTAPVPRHSAPQGGRPSPRTPAPPSPQAVKAVLKGIAYMCVDAAKADTYPQMAVQLRTCDGTDAQTWTLPGDGTVRAFGKCLAPAPGPTANGTQAQLHTCDGDVSQRWSERADATIVNRATGQCLDDTDRKETNGNPLQLWTCYGYSNQRWHVYAV